MTSSLDGFAAPEISDVVHQVEVPLGRKPIPDFPRPVVVPQGHAVAETPGRDDRHIEAPAVVGNQLGPTLLEKPGEVPERPRLVLAVADDPEAADLVVRIEPEDPRGRRFGGAGEQATARTSPSTRRWVAPGRGPSLCRGRDATGPPAQDAVRRQPGSTAPEKRLICEGFPRFMCYFPGLRMTKPTRGTPVRYCGGARVPKITHAPGLLCAWSSKWPEIFSSSTLTFERPELP